MRENLRCWKGKYGRNETSRCRINSKQIPPKPTRAGLPAALPFAPLALRLQTGEVCTTCTYHAHYTAPEDLGLPLSSIDHVPSFRQPRTYYTYTCLLLPSFSSHPPSHHHHPRPYRIRCAGLFASIVSCRYLGPSCPFVSPVFSILPAFPSDPKFF